MDNKPQLDVLYIAIAKPLVSSRIYKYVATNFYFRQGFPDLYRSIQSQVLISCDFYYDFLSEMSTLIKFNFVSSTIKKSQHRTIYYC